MFDGQFRRQVDAGLKPIGNSIKKTGVTADMITAAGIVMACCAAFTIGAGWLNLGLLFLILTGIPDLIDGAVAKAWGQSSLRGAFFDSVSDRLTDGLLFGGVAWYLTWSDARPWVVMLPVAAYVSASLVSYIRAKGDALGFDATGGLVERAERFILLGLGLLFSPLLLIVLAVIIVLNVITAGPTVRQGVASGDRSDPGPERPSAESAAASGPSGRPALGGPQCTRAFDPGTPHPDLTRSRTTRLVPGGALRQRAAHRVGAGPPHPGTARRRRGPRPELRSRAPVT